MDWSALGAPPHHDIAADGSVAEGATGDGTAEDRVEALEKALSGYLDARLSEVRSSLKTWIETALSDWAVDAAGGDPRANRRRQVIETLNLRGDRSAEILMLLIDCPDVYHSYEAITRHLGIGENVSENTRNTIRVHISHIRARLKENGLPYVIQNLAKRGYMVPVADAADIRRLLGEASDQSTPAKNPAPRGGGNNA